MAEERILVIQLRQLGDILLTTPLLRAIKIERPKARLTFLSHAMGHLIVEQSPFVDEHFSYSDQSTKREEWKLAKTLRERRFDLVFDFMNNPRSAFYTLFSGGKRRYAFRSARRPAYTDVIAKPTEPEYIVREKFRLLRAAGFTPTDERLVLPWNESHTRPVMKLYGTDAAYRNATLRIVLSPTHRRDVRQWPLDRYARLADRMVGEWGAYVQWLHGPGEEGVIDEVMRLCSSATHKAPPTTFREMAALIGNADLFVGNSNGPSHVAVAGNICSLQLHGPTSAASWCPQNDKHQAVQGASTMDSVGEGEVWARLTHMRPVITAFAAAERARRPKASWR